jgi:hypothetical protein
MTSTGSRFEYFNTLHNNFSSLYPSVNHRVINLYSRPRNFIMETGPVIDQFLKTYAIPGQPCSQDMQRRDMLQFINQMDDFTNATMYLFELHKVHVARCSIYMDTIANLDAGNNGRLTERKMDAYISLTPQLIELHNGLRELSARAENMKGRLQTLQLRWNDLRDAFIP